MPARRFWVFLVSEKESNDNFMYQTSEAEGAESRKDNNNVLRLLRLLKYDAMSEGYLF